MNDNKATSATAIILTSDELLSHWLGHRNLTRRVIEAFPEEQLLSFSIGGCVLLRQWP